MLFKRKIYERIRQLKADGDWEAVLMVKRAGQVGMSAVV